MSAGPATSPPPTASAADATAHHLQVLSRLTDAGLEIALDLKTQIRAATPAPPDPAGPPPHPLDFIDPYTTLQLAKASADLALGFARVSRAVRLSIALHERLATGEGAGPREDHRKQPRPVARPPIDGESETAEGGVRDDERREPLFDRESFDGLLEQPVGDIIARICADLGLAPDWPALAEAASAAATSACALPPAADINALEPASPAPHRPGRARDDPHRPSG